MLEWNPFRSLPVLVLVASLPTVVYQIWMHRLDCLMIHHHSPYVLLFTSCYACTL
jgi:hypothetical protein